MDDIPQDVLHEANEAGHYESPYAFLRLVGQHFADRAERTRALRKKSWQSTSRELDGVADHIRRYAEQLEQFAANNPNGVTLVGEDDTRWEDARDTTGGATDPCGALHPHLKSECAHEAGHSGDHGNLTDGDWASTDGTAFGHPLKPGAKRKDKEAPQLPGNTGRCASFRRADADDPVICAQIRGHGGDHMSDNSHHGPHVWPQKHSGAVCGDVVILHDGTALNCQRPLGHDGDEHHDGRYRLWPRGVGTSRQTNICERCNMDTHACPGCGEPIGHYAGDCGKDCTAPAPVADDELFPGQCATRQDGERCMLPLTHTGVHKGRKGATWAREPAATLGDIAEQQRAAMVIPEQRAESDPVPAPAAVLVAEMKEEVSATVADLTGDEPIGTTVNVGGIEFVKHSNNPFGVRELEITSNPLPQLAFTAENGYSVTPALSNPFAPKLSEGHDPLSILPPTPGEFPALSNPFQAPAPPPAAFLPPHLVPGEPKAHQSHSSITTMEKCGLQYRLKYRDGIGDDTPAWWNVAGTAFHTVVQAIEAAYASTQTDPDANAANPWNVHAPLVNQERVAASMWKAEFAELVERTERSSSKARSTWKAAKGGKEGEAFWREYGGDLARMYVAHRRRFLAEPEGWRLLSKPGGEGWAHEVEFNATVDGVLLKGFIDAAWISADGTVILIEDFKSGSSEGDPFQPKLYGAALRTLGFIDGRRVVTRFYEARKGAHSATVDLTPADDAEVSYRANTAATMDRMGIFPPNPSGYNCSTCPVKSRCPIMASKS